MTREEIVEEILCDGFTGKTRYLEGTIDDVFNYFENRTCSNCKYMSTGVGHMDDMSYCNADDTFVDAWQDTVEMNDFGCNKFEPKDD